MKDNPLLWSIALLLISVNCESKQKILDTDEIPAETTFSLRAGRSSFTINQFVDGQSAARTIQVVAPNPIDTEKNYPVVFAFHGADGSSNQFINNPFFNNLINSGEFIGVYPNGYNSFWNLGSENTNADDVEFVNMIVEELLNTPNLDETKMYALGFSNGAGMVNLLGKSTSHFKAIAPLFSHQIVSTGALTPPTSLSVFQLAGEFDDIIPLDGGNSPVGVFLSEEASALDWVSHFNCTTEPIEENLTWGSTVVNSNRYLNCDDAHEILRLIALEAGHGLSGSANSILISEVWNFFKRH